MTMDLDGAEEEVFAGVYRGVVTAVDAAGRAQVKVPALNGEGTLGWAMPCYAFIEGDRVLPSAGTPVWVMFEHGSIDSPVYLGTWS